MRSIARKAIWLVAILAIVTCLALPGQARLKYTAEETDNLDEQHPAKVTANMPYTMMRIHTVGNLRLAVTNWGFFGSQNCAFFDEEFPDLCLGAEFPAGSGIDYLFQGALWIGALIGNDTATSVGHDGWLSISEMYPESEEAGGRMIEQTNRPGNLLLFSEDAVSEQDFVAVYTDTMTDQQFVNADQYTGPHIPLYIEVTQKSYSWSYSYAQDFVLLDFWLKNIGVDTLREVYMGIYIDADVYHLSRSLGFADDICGFRETVDNPSGARACGATEVMQDTINIAWIGDNDGDPVAGIFDYRSPKAITGTRVVRSPSPAEQCGPTPLDYSFNWWISNGDTRFDWSPQHRPGDMNYSGGFGTPDGDMHKYRYMRNGEFDYDQIFAGIDFADSTGGAAPNGWIPPSKQADDLANGYDTRYLMSFGPFHIPVGDSLPVTMAYVAGENFHSDPDNLRNLPGDPQRFYENLDFTDLSVNARWAAWVFDNPGVDSDSNGCFGLFTLVNCRTEELEGEEWVCTDCDTVWYAGDGVPDYKGPPPPPAPQLRVTSNPEKVVIEWDGSMSETSADQFSFLNDFEGYRVYMADLNQVANFALLTSWDKVDFRPYWEDTTATPGTPERWVYREFPLTLKELQEKFGDPHFEPLDYPTRSQAYTAPSGQRYYFEEQDWNRGDSWENEWGDTVYNKIHRVGDSSKVAENGDTLYFGVYRFEIENLLPSQAYYFAVTSFDYGFPQNGLEPLESSPLVNSQLVYPISSAEVVEKSGLVVSVYPNPYKISDAYRDKRYEDPYRRGWSERDRRIHFINLPSRATIKIFTLDGDLVREFEHHAGGDFSETESKASWDLISKNTQAIVSGIYLYTVESGLGKQIGKIVVIK